MLQRRGRDKNQSLIHKSKSLNCITPCELTPQQLTILLSHHHSHEFSQAVAKQELLAAKHLFDPNKYFGSPTFHHFEDSYKYHQPRLQTMFSKDCLPIEGMTPKRAILKGSLSNRTQQVSPLLKGKNEVLEGNRRRMGKSPKSYVKQNKQNFMRLNLNNIQKVRVKLKLNKK